MNNLRFRFEELREYWNSSHQAEGLASLLRINTLQLVQKAGSGHIGSSFSVLDLLLGIHLFEQGKRFPIFDFDDYRVFSSKGHDVPAFYAVNHFLGLIRDNEMILRRLGFLPGHPELGSGGTITNTGSLGMGISKAKGFAKADKLDGKRTTTYVVLGDGELQEGQVWESMAGIDPELYEKIVAIVDYNGIQSDTWVDHTRDLGNLKKRVEAVGWTYLECDGHNFSSIRDALEKASDSSVPVFLVARTIKGYGSSLLTNFPKDGLFYHYHSGALRHDEADTVENELLKILDPRKIEGVDFGTSPKMNSRSMPNAWAQVLSDFSKENKKVIVMDGDLQLDTGTYLAAKEIGPRYMQMGIAEQDMVSTAGTLALAGYLPIVHSFATFLTMRAHEQIFNNASEKSRIIYVGFLAGIVPSYAGFSHQAVSDMRTMSAIPSILMQEPATKQELLICLEKCVEHNGPSYLRMNSTELPEISGIQIGIDEPIFRYTEGDEFAIVCSGSYSLQQAILATRLLAKKGIQGSLITVPTKTSLRDIKNLTFQIASRPTLIIENGNKWLGSAQQLYQALFGEGSKVEYLGVQGLPASGTPLEVSQFHQLDPEALSRKILSMLQIA